MDNNLESLWNGHSKFKLERVTTWILPSLIMKELLFVFFKSYYLLRQ